MSTMFEQFENWWSDFKDAHPEVQYADAGALRWAAWQAATEAAKATGTAGELPPLPEGKLYDTPAGPMHRYTINQMREYGGKCADAARNLAIEQAEAARQPAPVAKPFGWVQFIDGEQTQNFARDEQELATVKAITSTMPGLKNVEYIPVFAALAATPAPVLTGSLTTDQKRELLKCLNGGIEMGWIEQNKALEISSSILAGAQDPKEELTDDQKLRFLACIETGVAFEIVTRSDADAILAATRSQP